MLVTAPEIQIQMHTKKTLKTKYVEYPEKEATEGTQIIYFVLFCFESKMQKKMHAEKTTNTLFLKYPEKQATEGTHEIYFVSSRKKIDTGWMEVLLRLQGEAGGMGPIHHYIGEMFSHKSFFYFFYYSPVFYIYKIVPGKMFSHRYFTVSQSHVNA